MGEEIQLPSIEALRVAMSCMTEALHQSLVSWEGNRTTLYPEHTILTMKHGRGSVMLSGFFSLAGTEKLQLVSGKMGAKPGFISKHVHFLKNLWQFFKINVYKQFPSNLTELQVFCKKKKRRRRMGYKISRWHEVANEMCGTLLRHEIVQIVENHNPFIFQFTFFTIFI